MPPHRVADPADHVARRAGAAECSFLHKKRMSRLGEIAVRRGTRINATARPEMATSATA
jgi:hypothetical protein